MHQLKHLPVSTEITYSLPFSCKVIGLLVHDEKVE